MPSLAATRPLPLPPDIDAVRSASRPSPARIAGRPRAFLDGPGGSQAPDVVIDAMTAYLRGSNANLGGAFVTSAESTELVDASARRGADFTGLAARGDRLRRRT